MNIQPQVNRFANSVRNDAFRTAYIRQEIEASKPKSFVKDVLGPNVVKWFNFPEKPQH
jgi:hypothetical protein